MDQTPNTPVTPRRQKLVNPGLQLRLVCRFAGLAVLAMLLQFGLLAYQLTNGAESLGPQGAELASQVPGLLLKVLGLTALVVVPLVVVVGISLTHRLAGPVSRLEEFLTAVQEGSQVDPVSLRETDELKELAVLVNQATDVARAQNAGGGESEPLRTAA